MFLTHGYSVGVAVSYSKTFLICLKFCETMVIVLVSQACFVRLVCNKVSRSAMFTSLQKFVFLSFYRLSNLEFNSLICLGNWFNCLLLLIHIRSKI